MSELWFGAISGWMDGYGYGNLCVGLFYEHRFAMLKMKDMSSYEECAAETVLAVDAADANADFTSILL